MEFTTLAAAEDGEGVELELLPGFVLVDAVGEAL
jgi:hypothetical protein